MILVILVVPLFFSWALDSLLLLLSSCFTSSLFPSVSVLRSRDEISCQWRSVVMPRIQLSIFITPTLAFSGDAICYFLRGWVFVCCFAFCSCYPSHLMSSSAFHPHVFQNLHPFVFRRFSPLSVRSPDHTRTRPRHLRNIVLYLA